MYLHFIGADHEVTGSCHVLECAGHWIMVDRGMEQGRDLYENAELPCAPADIEAVLLTHAHIDHSGLLPLLYKDGFRGKIYTTRATADLCDIMLRDSAHIQEFEAEWRNRKAQRQGKDPYIPLYSMEDAVGVLELFEAKGYGTAYEILPGVKIRFTDVGHLLGSACIEVWLAEDGEEIKLVFSGDVGNHDQPILRDPTPVDEADYMLIESTYGDRVHDMRVDYVEELTPIIQRTLDRGGNVVVPSFAVGRTQEMLYFIRIIKEKQMITGHDGFTVVVDSPLANSATTVFTKHTMDCYDDDAKALIESGVNPIGFPGLKTSITSEDSIALNTDTEPKIILSASGMCEAGRIKHHLKHNLWRPESTVLFVGYQANGTVGRQLLDGAKEVKLFGEPVSVQAEICNLPGISGHADKEGLLKWAGALKNKPRKVFVVHGEDTVCDTFAQLLRDELGYDTAAPYSGAVFDLRAGRFTEEPAGIPIVKEEAESAKTQAEKAAEKEEKTGSIGRKAGIAAEDGAPVVRNPVSVFGRLVTAEAELRKLAYSMEGRSKKEIGKMLDDINDLIAKYSDEE